MNEILNTPIIGQKSWDLGYHVGLRNQSCWNFHLLFNWLKIC